MPGLSLLERWGCGECQKDSQMKQIRKTSACAGGYVAMCWMLRGHGLWQWGHMWLFFFCFKTFLFKHPHWKKKRQLELSRVTLKLRAVKFRGQCENSRRKSIFFFCCHLRVRANGVSMMQADFRLIVNVLPLVLLTFKHTSLSSFTVLPVLLSDHPPFHWTVFSKYFELLFLRTFLNNVR